MIASPSFTTLGGLRPSSGSQPAASSSGLQRSCVLFRRSAKLTSLMSRFASRWLRVRLASHRSVSHFKASDSVTSLHYGSIHVEPTESGADGTSSSTDARAPPAPLRTEPAIDCSNILDESRTPVVPERFSASKYSQWTAFDMARRGELRRSIERHQAQSARGGAPSTFAAEIVLWNITDHPVGGSDQHGAPAPPFSPLCLTHSEHVSPRGSCACGSVTNS